MLKRDSTEKVGFEKFMTGASVLHGHLKRNQQTMFFVFSQV